MLVIFIALSCIFFFAATTAALLSPEIEFTSGNSITLHVTITSHKAVTNLTALTWYHDGIAVAQERLSGGLTELTITDPNQDDVGTYEVMYDRVLAYPYIQRCQSELLGILRQYPLLMPATFELHTSKFYVKLLIRRFLI